MIGCIKAISPCVKSASAKLFLDLHTVLAPSGEERPLNAAAQVERARWCCRRFDSDTQTRCGSVTVMVLVSSASGPRVRGCPRVPRYFHPNPLRFSVIYVKKKVFNLQENSGLKTTCYVRARSACARMARLIALAPGEKQTNIVACQRARRGLNGGRLIGTPARLSR